MWKLNLFNLFTSLQILGCTSVAKMIGASQLMGRIQSRATCLSGQKHELMSFSLKKQSIFTTYQRLKAELMWYCRLEESFTFGSLAEAQHKSVLIALDSILSTDLSCASETFNWFVNWSARENTVRHYHNIPLTDFKPAHLEPHTAFLKIVSKCCWYFSYSFRALLYL